MLSEEEKEQYDRQLSIDEIGTAGQEKLKGGKIVVCGAGGLGSPVALYLAAAGIGTLTLIDHDRVTRSNLNRQILHGEADIGRLKVDSAKQKLASLNARITIHTAAIRISPQNVLPLVEGHEIIVDALDNLETRHLLNQAALTLGIPLVHGAVGGFEGRVLTVLPHQSTCIRCLHRGPIEPTSRFPVIGVTPAVIGAVQATEVIKLLLGIGEPLADRLMIYDGLKLTWKEFKVRRNPHCDHCGSLPTERKER